jgi:signal transduction histidine kinase
LRSRVPREPGRASGAVALARGFSVSDEAREFRGLLSKYAGGRVPPLVDVRDPAAGLIGGELLRVYHSGVQSRLIGPVGIPIPIGILLAAERYSSTEEKWREGDSEPNKVLGMPDWKPFCREVRGKEEGNAECEACDREWAVVAERRGDVIAYVCSHGLIDFAVPVSVRDEVVGVLFCGQFRPKPGPIWNQELLESGGIFRRLERDEDGVDVWASLSQDRIRATAESTGIPEGRLVDLLTDSSLIGAEIAPAEVAQTIDALRIVAAQISGLATSMFDLERLTLTHELRARITNALVPLGATPPDYSEVWRLLSRGLGDALEYFGLDYGLIISCCEGPDPGMTILCQAGLPEDTFPTAQSRPGPRELLCAFRHAVCGLDKPLSISLSDYKGLPWLEDLHRRHAKRSKRILVAPLSIPVGSAGAILATGRFKQDTGLSTIRDSQALRHVRESVTLVCEMMMLVDQLKEEAVRRQRFLEDVAHNLRTPVQNILVQAKVFEGPPLSTEQWKRLAGKIASQVRRLHRMSSRVWTLVRFERGLFSPSNVQPVNVYQTLAEYRKSLLDVAADDGVDIQIDFEPDDKYTVHVNHTLFTQAIMNLMDNAVKYSQRDTAVIVRARTTYGGINLSFVNTGIQIRPEETDSIFLRYGRTNAARAYKPEGTGIGLSIVQGFVDHCRGRIDVHSDPILGSQYYKTTFTLYVPHGR